jgi:hypothetical protein
MDILFLNIHIKNIQLLCYILILMYTSPLMENNSHNLNGKKVQAPPGPDL